MCRALKGVEQSELNFEVLNVVDGVCTLYGRAFVS